MMRANVRSSGAAACSIGRMLGSRAAMQGMVCRRGQGTAATALAGLYGAMKVRGLPLAALRQQRVVVVGAGSAGMGVVRMIAKGALCSLAPLPVPSALFRHLPTCTCWEGRHCAVRALVPSSVRGRYVTVASGEPLRNSRWRAVRHGTHQAGLQLHGHQRSAGGRAGGRVAGMQKQGATEEEANGNFWIVDYRGLVTSERPGLSGNVRPFARECGGDGTLAEGEPLADVVRRVTPAPPPTGTQRP